MRVTAQGVLVDFQDAELRLVIAALAEAGNINVIYGDLPARRVTLRMRQPVPTDGMLGLIKSLAQSNGITAVEEGQFLRLEGGAAPTAASRDTARAAANEVRLFVHRLKHAKASELSGTIQSLFGGRSGATPRGLRPVPLSETLRDQALPPSAGDSAAPSVRVGVELGAQQVSLPGTLRGEVQIVAEDRTNALLVRAQPADWEILRQTIDALDVRPLQVMIEVVIAEVRKTKNTELSAAGTVGDRGTKEVKGTLKGAANGDFVLELLKRTADLDLSYALGVLSTRGDVRIVSRPVILAQNNQEARILVGTERPFVQASRSLPTDAGVRDQIIQYRDVGTKLTIVPTINDDGYVNLQVLQEVSTATTEVQFGAPVISTREASTHLFVRDGQTAVIGGLIDRQLEKTRSGIPILMNVPVLGALFGSSKNNLINSELFLFLTPHIVGTDADLDRARTGVNGATPLIRDAVGDSLRIQLPPRDTTKTP